MPGYTIDMLSLFGKPAITEVVMYRIASLMVFATWGMFNAGFADEAADRAEAYNDDYSRITPLLSPN